MAVITPSTDLKLLKVPLEMDEVNQLTFASREAQYNYFNSLPKLEVDDFTYQRKDGVIRFGANFDDVLTYNYCMYRNDEFSDKWFYAFVTDVIWKSPNSTDITIKSDVWQTWQFDLNFKPVFVEREHVNDDTYGLHTVPEGLETGDYVRSVEGTDYDYNGEYYLAFQVTELISNMAEGITLGSSRTYNGIYNGLAIVLVDNYEYADALVAAYDDAGKHEAIVSCFYVPRRMETTPIINSGVILHGKSCTIYFPRTDTLSSNLGYISVNRPSNLDGYVPKNNKMFTKEFCYLYVTNHSGTDVNYSFEDFRLNGVSRTVADFRIEGTISQGCSIKAYPESYYKAPATIPQYTKQAYAYGISGAKLPICSWNSDYYTNWVTQNAVNQAVDIGSGVMTGLSRGGLLGAGAGLLNGVVTNLARHYEASLVPKQGKGNLNTGDINFSSRKEFSFHAMTVRYEYARICDEFMSQFGYKVNRVKIPNITGRRNWNYVKTHGCYIEADIPQSDLEEIKQLFNGGVTFWHNPATFADYSQNNDII